jgi:hypothetical protein
MSDNPFPFFAHRSMRQLKYFNIVRHHVDGDRQLVQFWCTSIEEAVIEAVNTCAVEGWHIESVTMDCDRPREDELFEEIVRQNFDNEFYNIVQHFNDDQS